MTTSDILAVMVEAFIKQNEILSETLAVLYQQDERNIKLLTNIQRELCDCGLPNATIRPGTHTPSCKYLEIAWSGERK